LGINSVSTEAVNGYELGLRIGLASYRVGFGVIGLNPFRYTSAHPTYRLATMASCWAAWRVVGWAEPVGRLGFGPLG
jgi:hypothetical protein